MKLVIMTKSTFFVEEDKILAALFDEGMDNLHLRKPDSSPMYAERLLSLLPEEYYSKITVHDHYYLKSEYNLAGIHIDDPGADVPDGYKGKYSRTCTNILELKEMKKKSRYVFLRNVCENTEFPDGQQVLPLAELERASADGLIDKKVYALGGMGIDNISMARELGFGGVVICEDLWNHFDKSSSVDYRMIIQHFDRLRKAVG